MANFSLALKLIQELESEKSAPHFFQLLHLLEPYYNEQLFEKVRLKPSPNLTFPAGDIKNLATNENNSTIELNLNFNSFYGVDAVLPQYFASMVATTAAAGKTLQDFLNIFNQRLYQLLYLAYKKSKLFWRENHKIHLHYLLALSGHSLTHHDSTEFAFAGLLGAKSATLAGLTRLLKDFLQLDAVAVTARLPAWITLEALLPLGQTNLGENTVLGSRALDNVRKLSIQIGPLPAQLAETLLPSHQFGQRLRQLISRYLGPLFPFEIKLILALPEFKCHPLNGSLQLGWLLNLGTAPAQQHTIVLL